MRISDWSSDVCSSDLHQAAPANVPHQRDALPAVDADLVMDAERQPGEPGGHCGAGLAVQRHVHGVAPPVIGILRGAAQVVVQLGLQQRGPDQLLGAFRSEEHTSELQSLMRISYAVFCLKKKKNTN